jgi:hypothetical protein
MNLAPNGINLMLDDRDRSWFESLCVNMSSLGMRNAVVSDPWLESDHAPFMLSGIPSLAFEEKNNVFSRKTYHSNQDIISFVSEEEVKYSTKTIGIVLLELANATSLKKWRLNDDQVRKKLLEHRLNDKLKLRQLKL